MPPKSKGIARKHKGTTVTAPSKKQGKKATKLAQAPVAPDQVDLVAMYWETECTICSPHS